MIDTNFLTTGQNYLKIGRHFRINLVLNISYFHLILTALAQKIKDGKKVAFLWENCIFGVRFTK